MTTPTLETETSSTTRRDVLRGLAVSTLALSVLPRDLRAQNAEPIASAKFADVVPLSDGVWAVVSKPLTGGFETGCNGGFVAGTDRVVAFEAFAGADGARWVLDACRKATGRTPTDLVLSHKHFDHVGGLQAFTELEDPPKLWTTAALREALPEAHAGWAQSAELLEEASSRALDVGGGSVELLALGGHTESDLVAVVDGRVALGGDLVWHGLFPNFVDAQPLRLKESVQSLLSRSFATVVPGHGGLPPAEGMRLYAEALAAVEEAARRGRADGTPAEEAAASFSLPASLGSWTLFGADYFERAFKAWYRALDSSEPPAGR